MSLDALDPGEHATVRALLVAAEIVFADDDWSEPNRPRDAFAVAIDVVWREGEKAPRARVYLRRGGSASNRADFFRSHAPQACKM
jgi:hypothetical protein